MEVGLALGWTRQLCRQTGMQTDQPDWHKPLQDTGTCPAGSIFQAGKAPKKKARSRTGGGVASGLEGHRGQRCAA